MPEELAVDLGQGQSLAVYGDNGTGKSSIADALEWYLTGEIELLAHEGRQHAVRNLGSDPERPTAVEIETTGRLGGRAVFPDQLVDAARSVAGRETFLLRGRTLADFINKTKTEKWRALAEILGLDAVERLRQDLQRVRTELRKRAKAAAEELRTCRRALAPDGKDSEELEEAKILAGLQEICRGLGIEPPDSLERIADPAWQATFVLRQKSPQAQAEAIGAELAALRAPEVEEQAVAAWNRLVASPDLSRLRLLEGAAGLVAETPEEGYCPVCGQEVDRKELGAHIESALLEVAASAHHLGEARQTLQRLSAAMTAAAEQRESLRLRAGLLGLELAPLPGSPAAGIEEGLEEERALPGEEAPRYAEQLEAWDAEARSAFARATEAPSDASDRQLGLLVDLCRQIQTWHGAAERAARAGRARDLADRVFAAFQQRQQAYLEGILGQINTRVAEIYDRLHPGEGLDQVWVEPWTAKGVELAINFHGSRQRPPHGVLSESHLNSLAIALFLAMGETFNEHLGFLVLDDVINSFDVEHRGSLAALLADKEDWQLIVLTHDRQFFEQLTRRAPSWRRLELTSWSFAEGPRTSDYRTGDLLAEGRACLDSGDTNGAATKARRALEEQLQEICEALRALLPFRRGLGNDRRELGELFKGVRRSLREHAKAWLKQLEPQLQALEADVGAILNVEAHASRGRASGAEVAAAIGRIEALDTAWTCSECGTRIWLKGTPEAARCRCGKRRFPPVQE